MATFTDFPMQQEIVLRNSSTTIGVMPDICLISHFQVDNWPVLYRAAGTGNVKRWGLPLMIPNFSRLKNGLFEEKGTNLPPHGFGRLLPWTVVDQRPESITLELRSNDTTRQSYPYDFTFIATIRIAENALAYSLTMENHNDEVMPIAPGFHPYFTIAQGNKARLTIDGLPAFSTDAFQWDTNPPNNPYPFPHKVTLQIPDYGTLEIYEEPVNGAYSLKTMQVWSEPVTAPDHAFVCFEPVVTSEDGLNRPADRINIPPHSIHQLILHLQAFPRTAS